MSNRLLGCSLLQTLRQPASTRFICFSLALAVTFAPARGMVGAAHAAALDLVATAELTTPGLSIRPEASGLHGAVTSGHHLASQAGLAVLRGGGNAVDAVVTMAAVLAVVRPHMNGVGGDAFALIRDAASGEVHALNASGRAGSAATPEFYRGQGFERVPFSGATAITVPGAVSGWAEALAQHGTINLAAALAPAITLARDGFVVSQTLAEDLAKAAPRLNDAGRAIFMPGEETLQPGDVLRNPALARTLSLLAKQGPGAFYGGEIGRQLAAFVEREGGALRARDFAAHHADWVEPVSTKWRGLQVYTLPPNSQGVVLLQMLGMTQTRPIERYAPNSPELLHELVEVGRLAFADRDQWVADPLFHKPPLSRLLSPAYLSSRAALVAEEASGGREPGFTPDPTLVDGLSGDTVYLSAVDADGSAVSWIQSLFGSFGSRLLEPETGIVLHNRGAGFSLEEGHPNQIMPGKRPFHTLMATLITMTGASPLERPFVMTIGTPGGSGQPQFVTQALVEMELFGRSPQAAVEAPRYRMGADASLLLEGRIPASTAAGLENRGHKIVLEGDWTANFGSLTVIRRMPNGVLRTGADMRREAAALAW